MTRTEFRIINSSGEARSVMLFTAFKLIKGLLQPLIGRPLEPLPLHPEELQYIKLLLETFLELPDLLRLPVILQGIEQGLSDKPLLGLPLCLLGFGIGLLYKETPLAPTIGCHPPLILTTGLIEPLDDSRGCEGEYEFADRIGLLDGERLGLTGPELGPLGYRQTPQGYILYPDRFGLFRRPLFSCSPQEPDRSTPDAGPLLLFSTNIQTPLLYRSTPHCGGYAKAVREALTLLDFVATVLLTKVLPIIGSLLGSDSSVVFLPGSLPSTVSLVVSYSEARRGRVNGRNVEVTGSEVYRGVIVMIVMLAIVVEQAVPESILFMVVRDLRYRLWFPLSKWEMQDDGNLGKLGRCWYYNFNNMKLSLKTRVDGQNSARISTHGLVIIASVVGIETNIKVVREMLIKLVSPIDDMVSLLGDIHRLTTIVKPITTSCKGGKVSVKGFGGLLTPSGVVLVRKRTFLMAAGLEAVVITGIIVVLFRLANLPLEVELVPGLILVVITDKLVFSVVQTGSSTEIMLVETENLRQII
nr:hypothetical protein HmN_000983100 [Hymenolepis microstoma]